MKYSLTNTTFDSNVIYQTSTILLSSYVMDKLSFAPMYFSVMQSFLLQIFLLCTSNFFDIKFDFSYGYYLLYILITVLLSGITYYILKKFILNEYITIEICDQQSIDDFINYVQLNPDYYDIIVSMSYGDLNKLGDLALYNTKEKNKSLWFSVKKDSIKKIFKKDTKIEFDDKFLNIKGYFTLKEKKKVAKNSKQDITREVFLKYIEVNIIKTNQLKSPKKIFNKIIKYLDNDRYRKTTLNYIKILTIDEDCMNHVVPFYTGKVKPLEEQETTFIKSLFHPLRDKLWALIKTSCVNPEFYQAKGQAGRVSLLLYGPPGTGKSTFAYRIAMCLYRHIISIDLRDCDRNKLYQILQDPNKTYCSSYKDVVYLFEEFDISITELHKREKIREEKSENYKNFMLDFYNKEIFNISHTNKENVLKSLSELKKMKPTKEFSLRDLLEIFQGPVPFEGMIMIASTNKYDEIKSLCPELFRPGRMTPVHFGYIDKDTLQDISKYYFNAKVRGYIPERITIPTSQIIELAFESLHGRNTKEAFEYFNIKINALLDENSHVSI